jgi:hypothetical protein
MALGIRGNQKKTRLRANEKFYNEVIINIQNEDDFNRHPFISKVIKNIKFLRHLDRTI